MYIVEFDLNLLLMFLIKNLVNVQVLDQYHNHFHYHIHDQYHHLKEYAEILMMMIEMTEFEFEANKKYFFP
jgi:hypothetical protein